MMKCDPCQVLWIGPEPCWNCGADGYMAPPETRQSSESVVNDNEIQGWGMVHCWHARCAEQVDPPPRDMIGLCPRHLRQLAGAPEPAESLHIWTRPTSPS